MKYVDVKEVFAEIPDEITLAISISGCPIHCPGCHSQYLWADVGEPLTVEALAEMLKSHIGITCLCLMGGDRERNQVEHLASHLRNTTNLKIAWYSGRALMPSNDSDFDYIKLGPYIPKHGSLKSRTTNQKLLKRQANEWQDITSRFWK